MGSAGQPDVSVHMSGKMLCYLDAAQASCALSCLEMIPEKPGQGMFDCNTRRRSAGWPHDTQKRTVGS
jgi:hypothetical protein